MKKPAALTRLEQDASTTVPPGRVQAVGFVQPFLWRRRDWVRVRLNVAGVSSSTQGSGDQSYTETVLLPVARLGWAGPGIRPDYRLSGRQW